MSRICTDFLCGIFKPGLGKLFNHYWAGVSFVEMFKKNLKSCEFCLLIGRNL